jgi:hypothetical protein
MPVKLDLLDYRLLPELLGESNFILVEAIINNPISPDFPPRALRNTSPKP